MAMLDKNGHEILDDTPVALPTRIRRQTVVDQVRDFIRQELSRQAQDQGHETFEESDDFDVGDDYDPSSPWEMDFDQENANFDPEIPADDSAGVASPAESLAPSGDQPAT